MWGRRKERHETLPSHITTSDSEALCAEEAKETATTMRLAESTLHRTKIQEKLSGLKQMLFQAMEGIEWNGEEEETKFRAPREFVIEEL